MSVDNSVSTRFLEHQARADLLGCERKAWQTGYPDKQHVYVRLEGKADQTLYKLAMQRFLAREYPSINGEKAILGVTGKALYVALPLTVYYHLQCDAAEFRQSRGSAQR